MTVQQLGNGVTVSSKASFKKFIYQIMADKMVTGKVSHAPRAFNFKIMGYVDAYLLSDILIPISHTHYPQHHTIDFFDWIN